MARSPSDATRFTATGPYVSAKSPASTSFSSNTSFTPTAASTGTRLNIGLSSGPSPPNGETPQQKIARLRAAAAAAKLGNESSVDRTIRIGRRWADRAHRFTALGLIGLTLISGAVATAGITDMILHNRRRRAEWLADKQAQSARELAEAKSALQAGRATEDQMLIINRERAAEESAKAMKERPGMFKRATSYVFGDQPKEEQKGGRLGVGVAGAVDDVLNLDSRAVKLGQSIEERGQAALQSAEATYQSAVENVKSTARGISSGTSQTIQVNGGLLDRQAQRAVDSLLDTSRSWKSWLTGR